VNSNNSRITLKQYLQRELEQFAGDEVPPEVLKKNVFDTLDTLEMVGNFTDLFTVKFVKSEADLLNTIGPSEKKKNQNKSTPKK